MIRDKLFVFLSSVKYYNSYQAIFLALYGGKIAYHSNLFK